MRTASNINKKHRVLIGTPHSDTKNYCIEDYIARVKSLSYPFYDVLVVDNSQSRKNYKLLLRAGIKAIHVKPKKHSIQTILAKSHEEIRKYALAHKYDYLLHLESDVIPPRDVIERLMIHNHPIVSAMYMINFGSDSHLMSQKIENFGEIRETINMKDGADLMMVDGKLKLTFACGLGCVLIHRETLKKFVFRSESGANLAPDSLFALDTDALGIPKYIDTSVLCEHNNSEWIYF
jgi:cellulose synthase/poly-beta-1,6-N-acetylglucosamine synthase-like glycosyltransferase